MLDQATVRQHQFDDFAQGAALGLLAHDLDLGRKRTDRHARPTRHSAHGVVQRAARCARHILQLLDAARPDAARWKIHHPQETGVVVGVLQQAQIGQRMLDLGAFEEAQTTVHAVRHARVEQGGLDHPALRVAAVEHRHFALGHIFPRELLHLVHHPLRLGEIAGGFKHPHRLTRARVRAQVLAQPVAVVGNQLVGRVQDVAHAAVVLLQLDLVLHAELPNEVGHVAHARAAEGVNALVIVAHGKHRVARRCQTLQRRRAEHFDPGVLQAVGVLKLVDQDVLEAPLVVLAHRVVVAQHFVRAQHQLAKIHHPFSLALFLVQRVQLDLLAGLFVAHLHIAGALPVFLAAADEILDLLGRKTLVVHVELLAQALDGRELVLCVEDLKCLRQPRQFVVRPQEPVAQAVEGADPHATHIDRQHAGQPRHHLLGRLVGEGDRQNAARPHLSGLQQPGDAGGQDPGLARSGAGQDERVLGGQCDGSALLGVQAGEQRGGWGFGWVKQHASIVGSWQAHPQAHRRIHTGIGIAPI